jgi:hypothetical protein
MLNLCRSVVKSVQSVVSSFRPAYKAAATKRAQGLALLGNLSRDRGASALPAARKVLIDGTWDNPNYWIRLSIVRRALALDNSIEVGMLGQYSRKRSREAFVAFGISNVVDLKQICRVKQYLGKAKALLLGVDSASELLQLSLPMGFPSAIFYDAVLKRQRRASVDVTDPNLPHYLAEAMARLDATDEILAVGHFDLVILSHALDYSYGAIAWVAIRRKIPVLTLYGDFGHAKFFRLEQPKDMFMYPERPTYDEICKMPDEVVTALRVVGGQQLTMRLRGETTDVGATYAYQRRQGSITRNNMASYFGWDASKPTIGIYNSNWFDYPHSSGLHDFRDFLDWIQATLRVATKCSEVNWLFKAHPCDDWYGKINGQKLEDLVRDIGQTHIRLADKSWNGLDLMRCLDGVVTCHGTIGIEAASQSIPVLVPYQGWYGHAGFVLCSNSREDYLAKLQTTWWQEQGTGAKREKAELFAGWAFCVPDWVEGSVYSDDSRQDEIYSNLDEFLHSNRTTLASESDEVAAWFASGHPYFHVFAMTRAKGFRLGNSRT